MYNDQEEKCLAMYDVTGIQQFIFSSPRAKENLGASIYVQSLFDDNLVAILRMHRHVNVEWEQGGGLRQDMDAEVIYIGGGNAMVLFRNQEMALQTTRRLAEKMLIQTRNTLGIAAAYHSTKLDDYQQDRTALARKLQQHKDGTTPSRPIGGLALTRECADGLPSPGSGYKEKGQHISWVAKQKLELADKPNRFDDLAPEGMKFPKEFDKLGRQHHEQSHIAVVHIDGNSMGQFIEEQLSEQRDYQEAVSAMRRVSREIREVYRSAFKRLCMDLDCAMKKEDVTDALACEKNHLPLRPLILSGDDVTFVCDGRIALQLTAHFLALIADSKVAEKRLSACAGIAIVKAHYPFHRAYDLAEALCANAKKAAKASGSQDIGSWLDYHIVYAGFEHDLDTMRRRDYSIPGLDPVITVDEKSRSPAQYNLLLRPFPVCQPYDSTWDWSTIVSSYKTIRKWPRSKNKALRNAFMESREKAMEVQRHNHSRGSKLPAFPFSSGHEFDGIPDNGLFFNNQTPYFEPLELLDFYLPELELDKEEAE